MNKSILLPSESLSTAQQGCVDVLREALAQAEAGKIHSLGIVLCMYSGYASIMAGTKAAELNLGCDSLKKKILMEVEQPKPLFMRVKQ
jgi:hypothetical protein